MKIKKYDLLLAYQWDMKFMSTDDMPLANILMSIENQYSDPIRERWQDALDFLFRLITCELADITWVGDIERNYDTLFKSLANTPPLTLDPGYWLEIQVYGTERCVDLIDRYQVDWNSPLIPEFGIELEKVFNQYGVSLNRSKFIPICI